MLEHIVKVKLLRYVEEWNMLLGSTAPGPEGFVARAMWVDRESR